MGLQFSGTTWNSFSHRKRKVPGLACQSSFSPQNRGQLYLSTPWELAWSKDANLHLAGRKPGFYFSQLPAGGAHVMTSQLCLASPLKQRFSRQGFFVQQPDWNLICRSGWLQIHGDPPASASLVQGLKACAPTALLVLCIFLKKNMSCLFFIVRVPNFKFTLPK